MKITNEDNMELMARYEDNYFDLAIVDPPYGIGVDGQKKSICKIANHNRKEHKKKNWDNETPKKEYFAELERVSKNQIIWGANYFVEHLTKGTKGWIVWDKGQHGLTMSDCELAYSSFDKATRIIEINRGFISENGLLIKGSIHPTQKPVKLYEWILQNCAKQGDKILDTHLGSGSIAIACHNMKYDLTACELDKEYYDKAMKRLKEHTAQQRLF
ncbi:MAG: site-specific DNA-methyltransferase [Deltaproteobacteria bacterium]|nr:site-specific DNA-methyltransferase [Deltaproteobacteria bacterium]